ncbi:MAG: hypothetical protein Q8N96_12125 [Methylovulum sp.]|nr:hypothetical protein [Methylovulum sp.]
MQPSALQRGDTGRWSVPSGIPTLERGNDTGIARGNDTGIARGNDTGIARGNVNFINLLYSEWGITYV